MHVMNDSARLVIMLDITVTLDLSAWKWEVSVNYTNAKAKPLKHQLLLTISDAGSHNLILTHAVVTHRR